MLFSNKVNKSNIFYNISKAKRLYFINYANYGNMKRNGEYEEYIKYAIPETVEQEWSRIVLDILLEKIRTGEDIWQVSNLANVRIAESEILKSFQTLAQSPNVHEIITAVEKSNALIPSHLFERIKEVLLP